MFFLKYTLDKFCQLLELGWMLVVAECMYILMDNLKVKKFLMEQSPLSLYGDCLISELEIHGGWGIKW